MVKAPEVPPDCKVDWFRVFADLERHGKTLLQIDRETGIKRTTLIGWRLYGSQAKLEEGLKIIRYWMKITKKPINQLPIEHKFKV